MHTFEILGDPVRRRILELLSDGEAPAGDVVREISTEFGISQPAISRQLRILRETGFTAVRPVGTRRLYSIRADAFDEADAWLDRNRRRWQHALDALETEVARGRRTRNS